MQVPSKVLLHIFGIVTWGTITEGGMFRGVSG